MKRSMILWQGFAACVLAASAAAQEKPNFAGRWTIQQEPAAAPGRAGEAGRAGGGGTAGGRGRSGDMGSGWGSTITITQEPNRLTVEYMFFGRGDMQPPIKFVYALDGSETSNRVMMGRGIQAEKSKVAWEGNKLVITTTHTFANPADGQPMTTEVRRTLSLEEALLKVETLRAAVLGGPPNTVTTVYVRSQAGTN